MILPLRRRSGAGYPDRSSGAQSTMILTVASSQNSVITAGISGSTGALDIHRQRNHRHQWRPGDERNRNNHSPGCLTSLGADVTTVGGARSTSVER